MYTIHLLIMLYAKGPIAVLKGVYTNHIEMILALLNIYCMITYLVPAIEDDEKQNLKIINTIILLRALRVCEFMRELPALRVLEKTITKLSSSLFSIALMLYTLYMMFAESSVQIFGGWISMESIEKLHD